MPQETKEGRNKVMWLQWTWWQMSAEREFMDEAGIVSYRVWISVQKKENESALQYKI